MGKIKALIFDVDNTITESCMEITDKMAYALNEVAIEIGFASGTDISELKRMISSKLKRKHHLLGSSGTHYVIIENDKEREMLKEELPKDEKKEIISAIKKLKEKYNLIPLTSEEDQIQDRGSQITISILGRNAPSEKKYEYDPLKKKRVNFLRFLRKFLNEDYDIRIGGTTSLDITKKGNNKFKAIKAFMKISNFDKKEIIFFGDQLNPKGNDFPVIKTGVKCIEVKNPLETMKILEKFNRVGVLKIN